MPRPDALTTTLALRAHDIAPTDPDASVVRVVPVWAAPPDVRVLAMLGECPSEVPAALRVVRHRLEVLRAEGLRAVGVTSAHDGEGKSTLATQIALVLGEAQRSRVLLVEASMLRPSLARTLGLRVPEGLGLSVQLSERMRGSEDPFAVLALGPSLHALVESEAEASHPETLHSAHFRLAIESLARAYDWVVVDAPSILGSGDANVVEEAVDGVVIAARSGRSHGGALRAAVRQLGRRKAIGVVLWDR